MSILTITLVTWIVICVARKELWSINLQMQAVPHPKPVRFAAQPQVTPRGILG